MGRTIKDTRKPKKVYSWNMLTMEFNGEAFADPDPNNVNNWQIAANCTTQEPPSNKKGYVVKWDLDKGKWVNSKVK